MPARSPRELPRPASVATIPVHPLATVHDSWRTFWITAIAVFMVSLDATVVVAAFPAFRDHFAQASAGQL
ncbi:MAG: hypothetical protein WBX20_10415, partial [Terrimicrobiaceae bacterium]